MVHENFNIVMKKNIARLFSSCVREKCCYLDCFLPI